jgi:uncharacterized protein (DUF2132 family)
MVAVESMVVQHDYDLLTDEQIREKVQPRPTDLEWALCVKRRIPNTVRDGGMSIAEVSAEVRDLRDFSYQVQVQPQRARADRSETSEGRPGSAADWAGALAVMLAAEARTDPDVVAFRRDVLNDRLFATLDAAVEWITPMVDGDLGPIQTPDGGLEWPMLPYEWPDSPFAHNLPATSVTARTLSTLVHRLAEHFGWHPAQATTFVLCGITPAPSVLRVSTHLAKPAWKCRVVIEAHPIVDPKEVQAAYKNARKQFMGWAFTGERIRTRETKTYRVAAWVAENDADSWPDLLEGWNAEHPNERFSTPSELRRIALRGAESVMGPGTTWRLGDDDLAEDA